MLRRGAMMSRPIMRSNRQSCDNPRAVRAGGTAEASYAGNRHKNADFVEIDKEIAIQITDGKTKLYALDKHPPRADLVA